MAQQPTALGIPLDGTDIEDGELVNAVVVVAEVLGENGKMYLKLMNSNPMTAWQMYGFLRSAALGVEIDLRDTWEEP